jgi:hypothetical protein
MAKKRSTKEPPEEMWSHIGDDLEWFAWSWKELKEPIDKLEKVLAAFDPHDPQSKRVKDRIAKLVIQLQVIGAKCPMIAGPNPSHAGQGACFAPSLPVLDRRGTRRRKS